MNRSIGGIPIIYWIGALGLGIGAFAWIKKRGSGSTTGATAKPAANSFTQAQEVQDFQIFSALTGAQQGADLNFLTEVAGLFSGGSSTGTTGGTATGSGGGGGGGSTIPSPPPTGTSPPATVPVSTAKKGTVVSPQNEPGYGSGVAQLLADNPALTTPGANVPGITGYTVSYNGVPI